MAKCHKVYQYFNKFWCILKFLMACCQGRLWFGLNALVFVQTITHSINSVLLSWLKIEIQLNPKPNNPLIVRNTLNFDALLATVHNCRRLWGGGRGHPKKAIWVDFKYINELTKRSWGFYNWKKMSRHRFWRVSKRLFEQKLMSLDQTLY